MTKSNRSSDSVPFAAADADLRDGQREVLRRGFFVAGDELRHAERAASGQAITMTSDQSRSPERVVSRRGFLMAGAASLVAVPVARAQQSLQASTEFVNASGIKYASRATLDDGIVTELDAPFAADVPRPTRAQLEWQRDELALFLHFGVNTFSNREWGDGKEDPKSFAPAKLDARQWAQSAKAAGFRALILTAKHHDGFCLWPTKTTTHSVASSSFRDGKGDVVREFVDACRAEGLKAGLYCSPWDRNASVYGDSAKYNDMFMAQLSELLTQYGTISEVWFDGANGEGPNGKKQVYDWPRTWAHVRKLQPNAVIFSDAGPDIRWIGNERGDAGATNWSRMNPADVPYPGVDGPTIVPALQNGNPSGSVWRPGETDVSIRPGWFYHPAEDAKVKSGKQLVDLYFSSVGRNSKLLLNVPPTRDGLLHDNDVANLKDMRAKLDAMFRENFAAKKKLVWKTTGAHSAIGEIDLGRTVSIGIADLREDIERGQSVAKYTLEGFDGAAWRPLSTGTTIGYRKLDRFAATNVSRVRITVSDSVDVLRAVTIGVYAPA